MKHVFRVNNLHLENSDPLELEIKTLPKELYPQKDDAVLISSLLDEVELQKLREVRVYQTRRRDITLAYDVLNKVFLHITNRIISYDLIMYDCVTQTKIT